MSKTKIALNAYAKRRYNVSGEVDVEVSKSYMGVLLMLASADGELSARELEWLVEEQELLGAPAELIEYIKNYDWQAGNLDAMLEKIHYDFPLNAKCTIIYQAIKMSKADQEYHHQERTAIWKAAQALGIEENMVRELEALVNLENNIDRMRYALLGTATD